MTKPGKKLLSGTGKIANAQPGEPLKVVFEPGCFDHIDVENQEELDRIMAEIQTMFAGMSREELEAQSRPLTDEDIDDLDPEEREALMQALEQAHDQETRKQRLN